MFITPDQVKKLTNVEVSGDLIFRAQNVVEAYVGKNESEIKNGKDKQIMAKAVGYQAAYMKENEEIVYQQVAVNSAGAGVSFQNFDPNMAAPWLSPLAVMVVKNLTFNRTRSYKTGRIFQFQPRITTWRNY